LIKNLKEKIRNNISVITIVCFLLGAVGTLVGDPCTVNPVTCKPTFRDLIVYYALFIGWWGLIFIPVIIEVKSILKNEKK